MGRATAHHVDAIRRALTPFVEAIQERPAAAPVIADFMAGNPQDPTLPGVVEALRHWSVPQSTDWFAYRSMHEPALEAAAESLSAELGMRFSGGDIVLTRGAFGGLALTLKTVVDPGDEVIFVSPPWFFYEAMIIGAGATPVRVRIRSEDFDLDLDAVERAITPRTRAVIVNTPHNPTGRIYPAATLEHLASLLADAERRHGRPVHVISDEAYSRILFDGNAFVSPGRFHPHTFLIHTYSKSALAPGQRLGFVALAPGMPDREEMRRALGAVGLAGGYGMPDAVMQYALADIDPLMIDLPRLQRRRDRMVASLRELGYGVHVPESTFYLLPRCPVDDDRAFCARLAAGGVVVLPGYVVEQPGYLRLSLTATDEMIERSLPVFAAAMEDARRGVR